jgi:hypothetical protein
LKETQSKEPLKMISLSRTQKNAGSLQRQSLFLAASMMMFLILSTTTTTTTTTNVPVLVVPAAQAFAPILPSKIPATSTLSATKKSSSPPQQQQAAAQFEYQELVAQLDELQSQKIAFSKLTPTKQQELAQYTRTVATQRNSPIPLTEMAQALPGTTWKLLLSTQPLLANDLPADASVVLDILDSQTLSYNLKFSKKTFGLQKISAQSQYTVDVSTILVQGMYHHGCATH